MNAQALFEFLLSAQQAGVDLRNHEIIVLGSRYTEGGYEPIELYPEHLELGESKLFIGESPCSS